MNTDVDFYFAKGKKWQTEMTLLRKVILEFPLTEELKWGVPCYTMPSNTSEKKQNNVLLIHAFKEYCAVLFIKGAILKDPDKLLVQQTENVQAGRQIRFTNEEEVLKLTPALKVLIKEAISVEKEGLKIPKKKTSEYTIPIEFQEELDKDPNLQAGFKSLTPGRQRGYLLFFSSAKQSKTRSTRIEKFRDKILNGKGLDD
ncbi:YdeI/OmpD-associated family protein [Cyclobacterium qasimii]|uniref:DUF1801 domain-containing protein n=2 Tax=Cyclobacterium qasimii TaxID=1350429 RepID=S7VCR4_9BACT|nr:DUF1801 domain-containing protein [Cyclobacterium qasimii]EPR67756.1 DUF1801 domain-containing protein [Cyclobacterium qasimii M12-11B]GEO20353.1 hypothetical protein CQA01_08870 [Cyclobacterium qasimii]